jgi:hypothetical protein
MAEQFQKQVLDALQRQSMPQTTFVPNMANQSPSSYVNVSEVAKTLGMYTYNKLPHFRNRGTRNLGRFVSRYAIPDDIYTIANPLTAREL